MEFLTSGQKIRTIRKRLGMKQHDLENSNITRSFISMVESGKRGLSRKTAQAIVANLKQRAIKNGININVDEDYILMTPEEEAAGYCIRKIKCAKEVSDFDEIIDILKKYKLDEILVKAYIGRGDLFYQNKDYLNALLEYNEALDIDKNTEKGKNKSKVYNKLGLCKTELVCFKEAISYFNKAIYYSKESGNLKTQKETLRNIAVCYKKMGKYDTAIDYLNKYILILNKKEEYKLYINAFMLKASCLKEKCDWKKAVNIYMELLEKAKDQNCSNVGYIYNNLAVLYLEISDLKKSLECFKKAEQIRKDNELPQLCQTHIDMSRFYIKQQNYNEALKLLDNGLNEAEKNNDNEYILKCYYLLSDVYSSLNEYEKLEETYINILNILKKNELNKDILKVYIKMSFMYIENNNIEKSRQIQLKMYDILRHE